MSDAQSPTGNIRNGALTRPEWSVVLAKVDQKAFGDSGCELASKDRRNPDSEHTAPGV
jgi:hypothetical protein